LKAKFVIAAGRLRAIIQLRLNVGSNLSWELRTTEIGAVLSPGKDEQLRSTMATASTLWTFHQTRPKCI